MPDPYAQTKTSLELTLVQRSRVFLQLATLEASGVSAGQAMAVLAQSAEMQSAALASTQKHLAKGRSVSEAGFRGGLFDATERVLIHAGVEGGCLAQIYQQLGDYYGDWDRRRRKVLSRLYLPGLTLVLALLIQPLPALISGKISTLVYLQASLGVLLGLGVTGFGLWHLPKFLRSIGIELTWQGLLMQLPIIGQSMVRRQLNKALNVLGMLLECGLPFATALPKAVATMSNPGLRQKFSAAIKSLSAGASVADTLSKVPVIRRELLGIIRNAEASGKLATSLQQITQLEAEAIALQDDAWADWLPRLIYILVCVWMAYGLLSSNVATVIPANL